MDTDQNGTITIDELRRGLREQGSTVSEEELDTLVRPAAGPVHGAAAACLQRKTSHDSHVSRPAVIKPLPCACRCGNWMLIIQVGDGPMMSRC